MFRRAVPAGCDGVVSVHATGDRKVEFIAFAGHTLAYVRSALGYPAYYRCTRSRSSGRCGPC